MPLNIGTQNESPFNMMDSEDLQEAYPDHLKTQTQRTLMLREIYEDLDLVSDEFDLEQHVGRYKEDIKFMGRYQHDAWQKRVHDMRVLFADTIPY